MAITGRAPNTSYRQRTQGGVVYPIPAQVASSNPAIQNGVQWDIRGVFAGTTVLKTPSLGAAPSLGVATARVSLVSFQSFSLSGGEQAFVFPSTSLVGALPTGMILGMPTYKLAFGSGIPGAQNANANGIITGPVSLQVPTLTVSFPAFNISGGAIGASSVTLSVNALLLAGPTS